MLKISRSHNSTFLLVLRKFVAFLFCFVSFSLFAGHLGSTAVAQQNEQKISPNLEFINYLVQNGNYHEALTLLDEESAKTDTVAFLQGWCYYKLNLNDTCLAIWNRVNSFSQFGKAARFYGAVIRIYKKDLFGAKAEMQRLQYVTLSDDEQLLKQLFQVGFELAENHLTKADSMMKAFRFNNYLVADEQKELGNLLHLIKTDRHPSPVKAAFLSALLPGSGKWYAKRVGAGLGSLLENILLGAVAVETFMVAGTLSIPFALGGGLFAAFYSGNIIGSYFAAKTKSYDLEREHKNYLLRTLLVATDRQLGTGKLF